MFGSGRMGILMKDGVLDEVVDAVVDVDVMAGVVVAAGSRAALVYLLLGDQIIHESTPASYEALIWARTSAAS